ncbi:MAG TPA: hypothetical protein HA346_00375, partial [Thermoplasmata archaeon]|nr:hypothetical protein [Thermoplasmata archaeon]
TEGGASAICEAFARYVARKGGEVLTNAEVAKILVESGKVKGVELKDGSKFESDLVISTTGVKETVFKLVGRDHFPKEYVKKVEEIKHSLTAVCLRIALNEKVTDRPLFLGISPGNLDLKGLAKIAKDLGLLNITLKMFFDITKIMGIDLKELVDAFEAIYFSGALLDLIPGVLPIYAPVISNYDPSLAPEGKQLIQSSTATAPKPDGKPWEDWIKAAYGATCSVIPGVKEQTLWYDSATPEDLEKFLGKEGGSAFSTAQIVGQT